MGAYRLEILPLEGLPFTSDPVDVRAGLDSTVEISLPTVEGLEQTVTVTAPAFQAPEEVKNSGFLVEPREILKSAARPAGRVALRAGPAGRRDRHQRLSQRHHRPRRQPPREPVRGGQRRDSQHQRVRELCVGRRHVSLLDAELLQDVTFLTGGYPAPYINRTSSVLQVTQREGNREESSAGGPRSASPAPAPSSKGPSTRGRDRGSCRRDEASWICSPRTWASAACRSCTRSTARPCTTSPRDRIWMVNIAGIDEIRLGLSESTDLEDEIANFDIRYDGWRSATGFNWQRIFGSRGVGLLGISHSEAKVGQQVKDLVAQGVPPPGVPPEDIIAESPVVYFEDSREGETTFKYDLTLHLPFFETMQAGGSFKTFRIDYTARSPYGNDTPYSPVPGIDPFFLDTRFRSYQTGAYLQASKQVASRVNVTLGGRFDHYDILSQARFSPRAGVKVRLTDTLSWNSSAGSYYQQPAFLFVSAFPQNASLVPWRADHYRDGPGLVARRRPAGDGRGVPQDLHRLPGGERPALRVAGQHRRHLRRARDPVPAHERRRRALRGRGVLR